MTAQQVLFILIAAITLGSALLVVISRNLIHSALWLILALFGIAAVYVLLSASFLAVAQVVIYIGAIAILMIFAVMMTRRLVGPETALQTNKLWWIAGLVSAALFVGVSWMLSAWKGFSAQAPTLAAGVDPLRNLGAALVEPNQYVLPFELASVLLLAAMVGAIMIAWEKKA